MPPAKKTPAKRRSGAGGPDVTKALDSLNDAIERAQAAAKAVREDLRRSSLGSDVVKNVEKLLRDVRSDARKLNSAVRADLRKAVGPAKKTTARKPAAKKAAARKPAAKKPAARKPAAKRTAKKPAARKR